MAKQSGSQNFITGRAIDYNHLQGIGTIETDQGQAVAYTFRDLPIKDGQFILLNSGQRVKFIVVEDKFFGLRATNIKLI